MHREAADSGAVVDFYELTMAQSYLAEGLAAAAASFEVSCRQLPPGWGYLLVAGIDELLESLAAFRFDGATLEFLRRQGPFAPEFLEALAAFRFAGEVRAMREGTPLYAGEPFVEVTGTLFEAQLVETLVLNSVGFATLSASKAARCVEAAQGRSLLEFGLRRTQGADSGLRVARGSYLAGFDATSNLAAGERFGIPLAGTMAHSYIEAFTSEAAAFAAFSRLYPNGTTLLLDTYDTLEGARLAAETALRLRAAGGRLEAVRLDSGDLAALSRAVRVLLDQAGLPELGIVASGNLDEYAIAALVADGAPINGFGVGTRLAVCVDAPALDVAYKLVSLDGRPVMKLSHGKETLPGSKQVWRRTGEAWAGGDLVALRDEPPPEAAEPLLARVMSGGRRGASEPLGELRGRVEAARALIPAALRGLQAQSTPARISDGLEALRDRVSGELRSQRSDAPARAG